jgi:uncharacterized membrane protein YidH (DUF202 family)
VGDYEPQTALQGTTMASSNPNSNPPLGNDGTRQLLKWGASMLAAGLAAAVLLQTLLGGFSPTGASTNTGWFALIVALMCIPFGGLLLLLGVAKWLRNRSLSRQP